MKSLDCVPSDEIIYFFDSSRKRLQNTRNDTLRDVSLHYELDTRSYEKYKGHEDFSSNAKRESFVPYLPCKSSGFFIWLEVQSMAKQYEETAAVAMKEQGVDMSQSDAAEWPAYRYSVLISGSLNKRFERLVVFLRNSETGTHISSLPEEKKR